MCLIKDFIKKNICSNNIFLYKKYLNKFLLKTNYRYTNFNRKKTLVFIINSIYISQLNI